MTRHQLTEPRVQSLIDRLARLTLQLGSVNAVSEALSGETDESRIYPNRLHGLLAGDHSRSINTATLESIERGLEAVESRIVDNSVAERERAQVVQAVAAESGLIGSREQGIRRVAEKLGLPLGIVRNIAGVEDPPPLAHSSAIQKPAADWSWQNIAIERSIRALKKSPQYRAGLIVPTGGGKTSIALRLAIRMLNETAESDGVVLWITHRRHLRQQARRTLQELLSENAQLPEDAPKFLSERIRFLMVQELAPALVEVGKKTVLVIVDEAHHAAAPSYEPLFQSLSAPSLFLTATPNRRDEQPIGIDEVCYTISYRELFERGCLIEPTFDPPLTFQNLNWADPEGLRDLADYLLDRADSDFRKTLVVVTQQRRAETLHHALYDLLVARDDHLLTPENIGFVHGSRTSGASSPSDFLDEFAAWPRGILVATSQLIGEGFNDPSIDSVVVTYPSTSLGHLMQVAGRALRTRAGKESAHIVQVRESPLQYHFEQRWLYQDISDALHPVLVDLTYSNQTTLLSEIEHQLAAYRIAQPVATRILNELARVTIGETVNLVITGLPYWDSVEAFDQWAPWGALLVASDTRPSFLQIFNEISLQTEDLKNAESFLMQWIPRDARPGTVWKSYVDLIQSMEYARREVQSLEYAGAISRPYRAAVGTTWIRYITFTYAPAVSKDLEDFLSDVVNRTTLLSEYEIRGTEVAMAVKIELPLAGSIGYFLGADEARWFERERQRFLQILGETDALRSFEVFDGLSRDLPASPIPLRLLSEFRQFLRSERFQRQVLRLTRP
jgi:hypothetical protein